MSHRGVEYNGLVLKRSRFSINIIITVVFRKSYDVFQYILLIPPRIIFWSIRRDIIQNFNTISQNMYVINFPYCIEAINTWIHLYHFKQAILSKMLNETRFQDVKYNKLFSKSLQCFYMCQCVTGNV